MAELSIALPSFDELTSDSDTDPDSPMEDAEPQVPRIPQIFSSNPDPEEARLEGHETSKYLLAKSYFDCREFDRCAAIFLPLNISREPLSGTSPNLVTQTPTKLGKGKGKESGPNVSAVPAQPRNTLPRLSQKALFLALYARYMSGEKRKNEESEMILGPVDGGVTANKELVGLGRILEEWFAGQADRVKEHRSQGWLEYLYGIILIKGKSEEDGKKWLVKSLHLCPFNWGVWLELKDVVNTIDDVSQAIIRPRTSNLIGYVAASSEHTASSKYHVVNLLYLYLSGTGSLY